MRGNVVDMAVGIIIGGAFGKIISSMVADIIMPPIGLLVGGTNFSELRWELEPARVVNGVERAAVTINYGNFIQTMLDFVIIALPFSCLSACFPTSGVRRKRLPCLHLPRAMRKSYFQKYVT